MKQIEAPPSDDERKKTEQAAVDTFETIVRALNGTDPKDRRRILGAVAFFFGMEPPQ